MKRLLLTLLFLFVPVTAWGGILYIYPDGEYFTDSGWVNAGQTYETVSSWDDNTYLYSNTNDYFVASLRTSLESPSGVDTTKAVINSVTLQVRVRLSTDEYGDNVWYPKLYINYTLYSSSPKYYGQTTFGSESASWSENPATEQPWEWSDIEDLMAQPEFPDDDNLNLRVYCSMVRVQVYYTVPPDPPDSLIQSAVTSNSISVLAEGVPTDIDSVRYYIDDEWFASVALADSDNVATATGLLPNTQHSFTTTSYDTSNGESDHSTPALVVSTGADVAVKRQIWNGSPPWGEDQTSVKWYNP